MKNITYQKVRGSTPSELHAECLEWISQLKFSKDEQRFLNELIRDYTLPLIADGLFNTSVDLVRELSSEEKELRSLLQRVKAHINNVEVMLNQNLDEREEKAFVETHYYLKLGVYRYARNYRRTKAALFGSIKQLMKSDKKTRLLK